MTFPRTTHVLHKACADGAIVGVVAMLAVRGEIALALAAGAADREAGRPMIPGTLFRMASMTKLVVAVVAMGLVEDGVLALDKPIRQFLPAFAPAMPDGTVPDITLRHLLTHSAGLGYALGERANGVHRRLGVSSGLDKPWVTAAENLARIAQAPLTAMPGRRWQYSCATDVVGYLVEAATGRPLDAVVAERVTKPLGMHDTAFWTGERDRLAVAYGAGNAGTERMEDGYALPFSDGEIVYHPSRAFSPGQCFSGGVGLIGSAGDYIRFLEALRLGGASILSPAGAAAVTTKLAADPSAALGPGLGWSLGASILLDPALALAGVAGGAGSWGWGGVYGTHYFVDPVRSLSWVCMTNTALTGMAGPLPAALRAAIHADMEDGEGAAP